MTDAAAAELARKKTLPSPLALAEAGVPVFRTVQHAGEVVAVFPGCYHWGFACGTGVAAAINYATERWHGAAAEAAVLCRRQGTPAVVPHERLLLRHLVAMAAAGERPLRSTVRLAQELAARLDHARRELVVERGLAEEEQDEEEEQGGLSVPCAECAAVCFGVSIAARRDVERTTRWCARCALERRGRLQTGQPCDWVAVTWRRGLDKLQELLLADAAVEEGGEGAASE